MGRAKKAGGCFTPHITLTNGRHKELDLTGARWGQGEKKKGMTQIRHVYFWSPEGFSI